MKAKFELEQKVLLNGEEVTILTRVKDFANQKIDYRIKETGALVPEDKLEAIPVRNAAGKSQTSANVQGNTESPLQAGKSSEKTEIELVREEYAEVIGRQVATSKKNDIVWMQKKIAEKQEPINEGITFQLLETMDEEQLENLITEQNLDIDIDDYDVDSLRVAVAEELGIKITQ